MYISVLVTHYLLQKKRCTALVTSRYTSLVLVLGYDYVS